MSLSNALRRNLTSGSLVARESRAFISTSRTATAPMMTSRPDMYLKLTSPNYMKLSNVNQSPLGPLIRILIQAAPILFAAFAKAGAEAYARVSQEAGSRAKSVIPHRAQMSRDEALKIVGLEDKENPTEAEILAHVEKLIEINAPDGKYAGSPFIQRKARIAYEVLTGKKLAGASAAEEAAGNAAEDAANQNEKK